MSTELRDQLTEQMATAFHEHMMGDGEAALLQTSPLGQITHGEQRDAFELPAMQQEALVTALLARVSAEERERLLKATASFADSLTPALQPPPPVWDGAVLLRHMNAELQRQVAQQTADLRQANEILRASEERLRVLSEAAPIGIAETDAAGQCLYTNARWQQIYEMTLTESVGNGWGRGLHPADRTTVLAEWEAYIQSGYEFSQEFRIVTRRDEVRWVHVRSRPLHDSDGAICRHICTVEDITERKQAEAWLQGLVYTTQDALISINLQGHIVHFNPAAEKIFGYTQAEAVGQKVQLLMPEPYVSEHDSYVSRYEHTGERRAIGHIRTVAGRRKSGEVFPIELSVTEVEVGKDVRYSALIRDISEKVTLQEQLIEKERLAAIGMTAAKLAHEIGNPLNGMAIATQLLERRLKKATADDALYTSARALTNEIRRLSELLQEFRLLSGRQQFLFRPTNLRDLVYETLTVELPLYTEQGIAVEQQLAPDLPLVLIDQDKFKQVVLNLCKNAVEAMPEGGTLTVQAHNSGQRVHLEITDTGGGIPDHVNIFEPFVTTKNKGSGLGLPIVRQIVKAHGGTLTYASTPGAGTTFVVALPLQREDL